jgi:hypothetical protein
VANKVGKLLILSRPKPDENLVGYILRLTELNYCKTPNWLLKFCGIGYYYAHIGTLVLVEKSKELSSLSRIISIDSTELLSLACQSVNTETRPNKNLFFGSPVPRLLIRSPRLKVCPSCLRESNYIRKIWDLVPVTACPTHKLILLDKCPGCDKYITWKRKKVSVCTCGCDWRNYICDTVETSDLKVGLQIHRICNLPIRGDVAIETSDKNPLLNLNLEHFISALFFIAGQYDGASNRMGVFIAPFVQNQQLHSLVCRAFSVFEDWPNGFNSFLDWLRDRNKRSGEKYGVAGDFGQFFYRRMMSPEFGFIKEAFDEYLCTYWAGDHISRPVSLYVTRWEARNLLKIDFSEIDKLIEQEKLKAIIRRQGKRSAIFIELSDVLRLKRELDEALNMNDVTELLDVGADHVLELVAHKCLVPLRGPSVDGYSIWKFKREEIDKLLTGISNRVGKLVPSFQHELLDYRTALYQLAFNGISAGKFIHAVLNGQIQPCGDNGKKGLSRFLYSATQILDYRLKLWLAKKGEYLFGTEVAKMLGLGRWALSFLVNKGFILTGRGSSPKAHYKISKESLELFCAEYTVLPEKIAREKGTCSRALVNSLLSKGVRPVSGPRVDGGIRYVFRRADIEAIDIVALVEEIKSELKFFYDLSHLLDSTQAANILGVDTKDIKTLVKNGVLKPYSPQRHVKGLGRTHKFTPVMVKKFKDKNLDLLDLVSGTNAAIILGWSPSHFNSVWAKTNILRLVMRDGKSGKRYFSLREVKQLAK